jgi:hypothetical protein
MAGATYPPVVVFKMLPLAIPVMERLEVVAEPAKRLVDDAYVEEKSVEEALEKVCRAVQVLALLRLRASVPFAPPTSAPKVPEYESEEPMVAEVVATEVREPMPEAYTRLPVVRLEVVERPPQEIVGVVPPEEMMGQVPETEVTYVPAAWSPSDEVATAIIVLFGPPMRIEEDATEVRPVPPYATPIEVVPTMVPLAFVVRTDDGMRKSVVEPVEFTLKSVEVAVPAVVEPIAKSVEAAVAA